MYNLDDPAIRAMIENMHKPGEEYARTSSPQADGSQKYLNRIACYQCDQTWPCRARTALTRWEERH